MVSLRSVSKRFRTSAALREVSIEIATGEYVAILGPSGSGKTTLLRLIAGLEKPDEGEIWLDGSLVSGPAVSTAPHLRRVGMVFQSLALWPHMTAHDHLGFMLKTGFSHREDREREIDRLLSVVRLAAKRGSYPAQLSGGEQQRLALARAISLSPQLLLLDEPMNSLDRRMKADLITEIGQLHRRLGVTVLHVTHDWRDVRSLAGRVAELDAGKLERVSLAADYFRSTAVLEERE